MKPEIEVITFFESEDDLRLSHDGLQWILERQDPSNEDMYWIRHLQRIGLVQSSKEVLFQLIRSHGIPMTLHDRKVLAALEDDYWDFYEDTLPYGTMAKVERLFERAEEVPPVPERMVVSREQRLVRIRQWRARRNPELYSTIDHEQQDKWVRK